MRDFGIYPIMNFIPILNRSIQTSFAKFKLTQNQSPTLTFNDFNVNKIVIIIEPTAKIINKR